MSKLVAKLPAVANGISIKSNFNSNLLKSALIFQNLNTRSCRILNTTFENLLEIRQSRI